MAFALRVIGREILPAFLPYLLPQAAGAVEDGDGDFLALGAVTEEGLTCGAAAADLSPGEVSLFSLFVDPAVRRRGVGRLLLEGLLERAGGPKRVRAEWVLPEGDFAAVSAFFAALGFACQGPAEPVYRLETADLRGAPLLRRAFSPAFRPDANIVPYDRLPPPLRRELLGDGSIPRWLRPDGFGPEELLEDMSLCYVYGGRAAAYLLMGETGPGECAVLAALSREGAHPAAFLQLSAAALRAGLDRFGGDFACWLDPAGSGAGDLARSLTGDRLTPWRTGRAVR